MTAFRIIEEDQGTYTGTRHPHNGYYAGDFSAAPSRPHTRPAFVSVARATAHPNE
jgi:hypothetical protein